MKLITIIQTFDKFGGDYKQVRLFFLMVQNGVNMGEFQIQLLQKNEELTLYIIELKKIEELKK